MFRLWRRDWTEYRELGRTLQKRAREAVEIAKGPGASVKQKEKARRLQASAARQLAGIELFRLLKKRTHEARCIRGCLNPSCKTHQSRCWSSGPDGTGTLCLLCGLYYSNHGKYRDAKMVERQVKTQVAREKREEATGVKRKRAPPHKGAVRARGEVSVAMQGVRSLSARS